VSGAGERPLDPLRHAGRERRATLTDRATDALRAAIVDGRLRAGELYSVAQLADQLGVSRTPAREALLLLERQGMVRFERNRGARVLETTARDLDEIFALRLLLEVPAAEQAARRVAAGADDELLGAVEAALAAMAEQLDPPDENSFMAHDRDFHQLLLGAAGNTRLTAIVADLRDHVHLRGASTVGRGRDLRAIYDEHVAIVEALRGGDPAAVGAAMRHHLERTRELLVRAAGGA
jgi:DNA-binding GntR family transcriptional regulator